MDFVQSIGLDVSLIETLWQERRIKLPSLSKRTSTLPYIIIITSFLSGRKCSKSLQIQSNKDHWLLKSWLLLPLTEDDSYVACLDAACIFFDSVHINLPVTHRYITWPFKFDSNLAAFPKERQGKEMFIFLLFFMLFLLTDENQLITNDLNSNLLCSDTCGYGK